VISYVQDHKSAIGVIAVNWISDSDDSTANNFRKNIKVVALKNDSSSQSQEYYQPFQAYIALDQYPLIRDVYLINRESRNGLGTGFASFVAGDKGQRIVRLGGLLPATMPVRIIKMD
jgi:phosphate transport system substrate-binding protein